jgi:hypothetical protein
MVLIGLIGEAGSGKDTLADYLKQRYPVMLYTLANPIKEITRHMFLFNDEQLYGKLKNVVDERWGITPRESWQTIGTNIMQFQIYGLLPHLINKVPVREFWIHHFKMWYDNFLQNKKNEEITGETNKEKHVIVTDVRFQHEADTITQMGGYLIKIIRPSLDKSDELYKHCSETAISTMKANYTVVNDGTLEKLYTVADAIFNDSINRHYNQSNKSP